MSPQYIDERLMPALSTLVKSDLLALGKELGLPSHQQQQKDKPSLLLLLRTRLLSSSSSSSSSSSFGPSKPLNIHTKLRSILLKKWLEHDYAVPSIHLNEVRPTHPLTLLPSS